VKFQSIVFLLLLIPGLAVAHGDEDHGAGAAPAVLGAMAPRAEAHTELFEIVATPQHGQLTIYLDRSDTNEPVAGAKVEIESGKWTAVAEATDAGTYRVAAPQFETPGSYPLVLTVTAGDDADLLETTLVVEPLAQPAASLGGWSRPLWWWIGGALAALGLGAGAWVKRRPSAD
jgi:hypothetical protein